MIEYQVEFVPEDGSPIFICGGILMKLQRLISIVLTFVICLTLLAACSFKKDSGADKTTVTVSTTEKDDGNHHEGNGDLHEGRDRDGAGPDGVPVRRHLRQRPLHHCGNGKRRQPEFLGHLGQLGRRDGRVDHVRHL